jgi:hypothetical protein
MVTKWMETRATPESSLDRIRELAAQQAVEYGSSRVQMHTDNLGYTFEAVCECLEHLRPEHFRRSVRYSPCGPWLDEYLMTHRGPTAQDDALYIKLKLDRDCVWIIVCSFHLEGAL